MSDARESYLKAIAQEPQYAPAYLRLAYVEGLGSRKAESLAAFGEAEQLYRAASNVEGQTEVALRRGAMMDAFGEYKEARADLEEGHQVAQVRQRDRRAALADVGLRLRRHSERPGEISLLEPSLLQQSSDLLVDEDHRLSRIAMACESLTNLPAKARARAARGARRRSR